MTIKKRFWVFLGLFFIGYGFILYELLQHNRWVFLVGEVLLAGMVVFLAALYRQYLRPIHVISSGISLLREKNFSTYLKKVGQCDVDAIVEVYNQMVNQLRKERVEKEEQHHFLELLLEASPVGVLIMDTAGNIMQVNPAAIRQMGLDNAQKAVGRSIANLSHPLARELEVMTCCQSRLIQLDGVSMYQVHRKYFMDRGVQRPFYLIEDVSKQWLYFEKQSYEKVIRTMSHEVNNTVGSINSVLGSLSGYYRQMDDETAVDVREALEASIERNNNLNRFMANYASVVKIPEPSKNDLDINQLVYRVTRLFESDCRQKGIHLEHHLSEHSPLIWADQPQMEQVLVNVVKNSLEAIEKDGRIQVQTSRKPLQIKVLDNGKGLTPSARKKIFTPFYSDKEKGQGIGLTFVREVLLAHQFFFSLSSLPDGWTQFLIRCD